MGFFKRKGFRYFGSKFRAFWDFLSKTLSEVCNFFYILLRSRCYRCVDYCGTIFRFYPKNRDFAKIDSAILREYRLNSPFAISRRYLQIKLESDIYQYGETPLLTIEKIAQYANISKDDYVYELGCGTGRCAFWFAFFKQCCVVGVEQIPEFIDFSQKLVAQNSFLREHICFLREDFLSTDLSSATVIYLYGTKMSNDQIEQLILNLRKTRSGTKIITVSYSLNEIIAETQRNDISREYFEITAQFNAEFFWGKATVFIQKKV